MNTARSPLGRALLRKWFLRPPLVLGTIEKRHTAVECFVRNENRAPAFPPARPPPGKLMLEPAQSTSRTRSRRTSATSRTSPRRSRRSAREGLD